MIIKATSSRGTKRVRVIDIFAVPDYKKFFEKHVDSELAWSVHAI
jgi:hypothetical protein